MIDQNNHINDKYIRELLKWRLLEQVGDEDPLTQKLIDMEAKLVFNTEVLLVPSLQKENELLKKLSKIKTSNVILKWILPSSFLVFVAAILLLLYNHTLTNSSAISIYKTDPPKQKNELPVVALRDTIMQIETPIAVKNSLKKITKSDTAKSEKDEKWIASDQRIKMDYNPTPQKKNIKFVDYDNIPVLTEKQIAANNKQKAKMIKQLMKLDKEYWAFVPMSTDLFYDKQISLNAFYIATTEVTNAQYHVFLYDLLIHDKIDDYLKAVPDTSKWLIGGKRFFEPMLNMYFWHPAYMDFPVVNVSREGAKMYCDWLTNAVNEKKVEMYKLTSNARKEIPPGIYMNDLRIPMEEEWMMAARGGITGGNDYPWSYVQKKESVQNLRGCYLCNFSIINYPDSLKKLNVCSDTTMKHAITSAGTISNDFYFTAKVNSYNPNKYGLYNMSGNVAEMVWKDSTKTAITKGGSWNSDADHVKINAEENEGILDASPYIGFRPVFTAKGRK